MAPEELLSWSLFALSIEDQAAIRALCKESLLVPLLDEDLERLMDDLRNGDAVALSTRGASSGTYYGLCVLGRENPSPEPSRSLSMSVLTFAPHSAGPGRTARATDNTRESLRREIDRFCRTHGYTRIQCYAGMQNSSLHELLESGFDFEATLKTARGDFYSLAMDLPTPYTGDPYDGAHLLEWLAARFRMQNVRGTDSRLDGHVTLSTLNPHLRGTIAGSRAFPISILLSQDRVDMPIKLHFASDLSDDREALALSLTELRELTQSDRLSLEYWPPRGSISIAVEIRRNYFDALVPNRRNAFFDSGAYGVLLRRSLEAGETPLIFFVDFATSKSNPEVIGCGDIKSVETADPQLLWQSYGSISSWTEQESFSRYRSIKRKMTAIVFDNLRVVSRVGAGLPVISHSWTYVPGAQAYRVSRGLKP